MDDLARGPLELADWRRRVAAIYADVRSDGDSVHAHGVWRSARDELFATHGQSPLTAEDELRSTGLPYWPYEPALRFEVAIEATEPDDLELSTGDDGVTRLRRIGVVSIPEPVGGRLDVWWLQQYGGGLFVPFRDGTAGDETYGAGRYLLDTAKGADLGGDPQGGTLVLDFNFAYHPSCRYDPRWVCPLAPLGNRLAARVEAGERL